MQTVLLVIHLIIAIALIGVVLLQRSEGGALGIGGGNSGSLFSARGVGNTLTRTTEIAIGRLKSRLARSNARATPAALAATSITTLMAIGPTYPPSTNAAIDPTVATTALVSGLSR